MGRRGYPPEFRRKVLDLVEAGRSVAEVADDLGISDQDPPVQEQSFYRPLERLKLPEGTRFVAGLLHEDLSVAQLHPLLDLVESHLGSQVDVAAACGLARRGHDAALRVMRQGATLCNR